MSKLTVDFVLGLGVPIIATVLLQLWKMSYENNKEERATLSSIQRTLERHETIFQGIFEDITELKNRNNRARG